jgi:hypothetical protein
MKRGFINQKLGKRNSRRNELRKAKTFAQPSDRPPRPSNLPWPKREGPSS